jgi:hypothetical protein
LRDWSITARLSSVSVPALILVGEFDTMTEECSMLIVDNIPGARPLVTIPRAGELLPIMSLIHAICKNRVVNGYSYLVHICRTLQTHRRAPTLCAGDSDLFK